MEKFERIVDCIMMVVSIIMMLILSIFGIAFFAIAIQVMYKML